MKNSLTRQNRIAYQPGISYASLIVMKSQGAREQAYANTKFEWKVS